MPTIKSKARSKALLLIAPTFDEDTIVGCLTRLRDAGVAVALVGTTTGLISGAHGLAVRPDTQIDRTLMDQAVNLVIVPGEIACAQALMADPRVHQLIQGVVGRGGHIAVMNGAQVPVAAADLNRGDPGQFLWLKSGAISADYIDLFTNLYVD